MFNDRLMYMNTSTLLSVSQTIAFMQICNIKHMLDINRYYTIQLAKVSSTEIHKLSLIIIPTCNGGKLYIRITDDIQSINFKEKNQDNNLNLISDEL